MPQILTVVVPQGVSLEPEALAGKLGETEGLALGHWAWIESGRAGEWTLDRPVDAVAMAQRVGQALEGRPVDFALQADILRRKKLLVSDMDSTLIAQECIDELAAHAGCAAAVADITERAMRGELEFEGALRARVALLEGLPLGVLEQVWRERITLSPGAARWIATERRLGSIAILVSGGFEFFTGRVAQALDMHQHFANRLELEADVLTGRVMEPVLGAAMKQQVLRGETQLLGISLQETLAVGDGANDLPMLTLAGLGVAYRAKAIAEQSTSARIRHGDLTTLLLFQGIACKEWAPA